MFLQHCGRKTCHPKQCKTEIWDILSPLKDILCERQRSKPGQVVIVWLKQLLLMILWLRVGANLFEAAFCCWSLYHDVSCRPGLSLFSLNHGMRRMFCKWPDGAIFSVSMPVLVWMNSSKLIKHMLQCATDVAVLGANSHCTLPKDWHVRGALVRLGVVSTHKRATPVLRSVLAGESMVCTFGSFFQKQWCSATLKPELSMLFSQLPC